MGTRTRRAHWITVLGAIAICAGCGPNGDRKSPPKGYALAIGLNQVDPAHYGGWNGALAGCEPDAHVMSEIATKAGLDARQLLTKDATRATVLKSLDDYASKMAKGDLLVVSYSGHGGSLPDGNGDETDSLDETWLLYDGQLLDDELAAQWAKFKPGVRIFLLSDSCHSGTVLKFERSDFDRPAPARVEELRERWAISQQLPGIDRKAVRELPEMKKAIAARPELRPVAAADEKVVPDVVASRAMPPDVMSQTYWNNKALYDRIGRTAPKESDSKIQAAVLLMSGCQDDESSADLGFNGLFTFKLAKVWDDGKFQGGHREFHRAIRAAVTAANPSQSPNLATAGASDPAFEGGRPYALSP